MKNELNAILLHLKKNHRVSTKMIYTKIGIDTVKFNNQRRYGSGETHSKMIKQISEFFSKEMEDYGKVVEGSMSCESLLREQIEFYKTENARLREEIKQKEETNILLLNKLLEK